MPEEQQAASPQEDRVKELFQMAYPTVYQGGKFDEVIKHVEATNVIEGVTPLVVALVNSMIKDAGEMDMTVVFNVAVLLMADILESLQEVGVEVAETDGQEIISKGIQLVLQANPEFAQGVMSDPATQQMMAQAGPEAGGAPQGGQPVPQQPQQAPEQAGVIGGL